MVCHGLTEPCRPAKRLLSERQISSIISSKKIIIIFKGSYRSLIHFTILKPELRCRITVPLHFIRLLAHAQALIKSVCIGLLTPKKKLDTGSGPV